MDTWHPLTRVAAQKIVAVSHWRENYSAFKAFFYWRQQARNKEKEEEKEEEEESEEKKKRIRRKSR